MKQGFKFLTSTGLLLLVMFAAGIVIGLTFGATLSMNEIVWYVLYVVVKFAIVGLFSAILMRHFAHKLGTRLGSFLNAMHDDAPYDQENLSPVVIMGGLLFAVGQIFAFASASTPWLYVYEALTRGAVGLALGVLGTMFISLLVGVRSFDHFFDLFKSAKNNQLVIFVMIAFNTAVLIAMKS